MSDPIDELRAERLKKMERMEKSSLTLFPARLAFEITNILAVREDGLAKQCACAGRVRSMRSFGKLAFVVVEDESGKIQIIFKQGTLENDFTLVEDIDLGDFIEVRGETAESQTGEFSVLAQRFNILAKAIRPLPSQHYGLNDVESRARQRYLDLLMNKESKKIFELRSNVVFYLRKFLIEEKGYTEVESPVLQPLYGGTRARPFKTHHNALDQDLYLRISNELYLKRLIIGGFERVFEIGHTFRNEGMDKNHNPEFTMLETMHAYADYQFNMDLVEEMFEYVVLKTFGKYEIEYQGKMLNFKRPWLRISVEELFAKQTGLELNQISTIDDAFELARKLGVSVQDYMTDSEILLEIFETQCACELTQPTLVYDYPADFYPLAKRKADNPRLVESFDIYVAGMEMGTNYSEQNDPRVLREAWGAEKQKMLAGNPETQPMDEDFLEALEYGMPPTSGIGPGIDRWVMILANKAHLRDVILFPTMRSVKNDAAQDHETSADLVDQESHQ